MTHPTFRQARHLVPSKALRALAIGLFFSCAAPAFADELKDIQQLVKRSQFPQALEKVDAYLGDKPKDAQARFLKGVIHTELNQPEAAIEVLSKLSEDYPELPEPYNNLAVLYAQQKQYEQARVALETAVRAHPSYAIAYENLGDLYAKQASEAYDKAARLDSKNASAQRKLALTRELFSISNKSAKPARTTE